MKIDEKTIERFHSKYIPVTESGCWLWIGTVGKHTYGVFDLKSKAIRAHRFSYMLFKGEIPEGFCVCHACDVTCCVNPDHLWLGTHKQNTQDMMSKGRWTCYKATVTHCRHGHEFTPETTGMYKGKAQQRYCLICKRTRGRVARARRRLNEN